MRYVSFAGDEDSRFVKRRTLLLGSSSGTDIFGKKHTAGAASKTNSSWWPSIEFLVPAKT